MSVNGVLLTAYIKHNTYSFSPVIFWTAIVKLNVNAILESPMCNFMS